MQAAGRHAPGGPRVSGTTVSLSGPSPRVLGPQVKARPLTGTPSALRSSCNARLFPGVPRRPQEDWARPFSFFSLFKLLTLELCTSFTICFQIFFFSPVEVFLWAMLAFQCISAVWSGHFPKLPPVTPYTYLPNVVCPQKQVFCEGKLSVAIVFKCWTPRNVFS